MATDLEKLVVQLSADFKSFEKSLARQRDVSNRQFNAIERRARQMNKNLDGIFARSFKGLTGPLAGIGAALGTNELRKMTDTWTDLNSRVALAAGGIGKGTEVMGRLGEMARRTYSDLEQTAESYLANSTALQELGYSIDQSLDYTEALNNALVVSGAKNQRAATVTDALAKAMALGTLSGQNLNTVISQGGRVAEALAAGLNTTVGGLRKLGAQGKITGNDIVKSLTSQMEVLRREAEEMPATIGDGLQLLHNAMLEYVGNADQATGVSAKISEALVIMADNFDKTADVALQLAGVIAGALVGRSLLKMISTLGLAGSALIKFTRTLSAARTMAGLATAFTGLGAAAGPVGLLIGGAVALGVSQYALNSSEAAERTDKLNAEMRKLGLLAPEVSEGIDAAAESLTNLSEAATVRKLKEIREELDAIRKSSLSADGELKKFQQNAYASKVNRLFSDSQDVIDNKDKDQLIKLAQDAEKAGAPLDDILNKINEIRNTSVSQGVVDLSNELEGAVKRVQALHAYTNQFADTLDLQDARDAVQSLSNYLDLLSTKGEISAELKADLQLLITDFFKTEEGANDTAEAILKLGEANPNMSGFLGKLALAIQEMGKVVIAADKASAAMAGVTGQGSSSFSRGGRTRARQALLEERQLNAEYVAGAKQRASLGKAQYDLESKIAQVRAQAEKDGRKLTEAQIKEIAQAQLAGDAARSAEGRKPRQERADEYERLTQSITDRTAALVAETEVQRGLNPLIEDYGYAAEKARAAQELLNAAEKAGIEITPALRAEIAQTAEQFAVATVEAGKLAEAQDKIRQNAEEMAEFQKDLTRGMVDGFIQGKKAADIFADALSKVGDRLLDLAFNSMFDIGGGGILGGLFGGGQAGIARGGGIGLYSSGGYTGSGGVNQPAGIVHKGEVVWSQKDVARAGGVAAVEAMRLGLRGYSTGGPVAIPAAPRMPSLQNVNKPNSSVSAPVSIHIDATGADAEGLARVQMELQKLKGEIPARVVSSIRNAQNKNVKLW